MAGGYTTNRPAPKLKSISEIGILPWSCNFVIERKPHWCDFNQDTNDQADAVLEEGRGGFGPSEGKRKGKKISRSKLFNRLRLSMFDLNVTDLLFRLLRMV